jgi:hypothetical protein
VLQVEDGGVKAYAAGLGGANAAAGFTKGLGVKTAGATRCSRLRLSMRA